MTGSGVHGPRKPIETLFDWSSDLNHNKGLSDGSSGHVPLEAHADRPKLVADSRKSYGGSMVEAHPTLLKPFSPSRPLSSPHCKSVMDVRVSLIL